jgi:hypothetical protein
MPNILRHLVPQSFDIEHTRPVDGYYRNASCALNYMSTRLLGEMHVSYTHRSW